MLGEVSQPNFNSISNTKLYRYRSNIFLWKKTNMDKSEEVATVKSGCSFCGEPDPGKKCSKNHSRCKGKLFCKKKSEKNCELAFHKMEQAAKAKALEDERNTSLDHLPQRACGVTEAQPSIKTAHSTTPLHCVLGSMVAG